MKNVLTALLLLMVSLTIYAQNPNKDYFAGNWDVLITGALGGNQQMEIKLIRKDGQLHGTITSKDDGTVEIKKVEENDHSIRIYFKHGWFTVNLLIEKEDENNCSGKLMDKYPGKCKRINKNNERK